MDQRGRTCLEMNIMLDIVGILLQKSCTRLPLQGVAIVHAHKATGLEHIVFLFMHDLHTSCNTKQVIIDSL
jgi:hypothetical protein